ncbi:uncharacterized protein BDZ99DRAFT_500620 [Mytilinidion resinicola]|uniref:F-box domain-containing protein n=1 Tax=Mytilinidion resinicola TaxID=574789 RepID=A0A6A6YF49_9PEZI|nr:uncharacterized protein BDZ99DRAFT_500620 [Mytilinidion resinicola]KAF2807422.1 hypothetical protein BDZ99DRAFT_500620 [Mytilinidion resinicola]
MSFSDLPIELLLKTASYLEDSSLSRLSRACAGLHKHLEGELYKRATTDRPTTMRLALVRYLLSHDVTGNDPDTGTWDVSDHSTHRDFWNTDIATLFVRKAAELEILDRRRATGVLGRIIGCTWSRWPAGSDGLELMELLLSRCNASAKTKHGADVNYLDHHGTPVLFRMIYEIGDENIISSVVRTLLEAGADPNRCSSARPGYTPLGAAIDRRFFGTAMTLIKSDPSLAVKGFNSRGGQPTSPLHQVVREPLGLNPEGQLELTRTLIELGAKVFDSHLDPALMLFYGSNGGDMITLLLEHGADPDKPGAEGRNFLQRFLNCLGKNIDWGFKLDVLTRVATKKKLPGLLPGEVIVWNAEIALHEMQMIPKTRGNVSGGFAWAKKRLAYIWEPLEGVVKTFEPEEFPFAADIHRFWNQHHVEVEGYLGESVTLMNGL